MDSITDLLLRSRTDRSAADKLYGLVYQDLRRQAHFLLRKKGGKSLLQTTELVHEAFLKLVRSQDLDWANRYHFLNIASRAMRQVLVEYARRRNAQKRGGGAEHFALNDEDSVSPDTAAEILAVEDYLLRHSSTISEEDLEVVILHYFGGLSFQEIADLLSRRSGIPHKADEIEKHWEYVRATLSRGMRKKRDSS